MTQGPIIRAASPLVSSRHGVRLTKGVILPLLLPCILTFSQASAQYSGQAIGAFQPFSGGAVQSDYQIAQPTIINSIPSANSVVALSAAETAIGLMPANNNFCHRRKQLERVQAVRNCPKLTPLPRRSFNRTHRRQW